MLLESPWKGDFKNSSKIWPAHLLFAPPKNWPWTIKGPKMGVHWVWLCHIPNLPTSCPTQILFLGLKWWEMGVHVHVFMKSFYLETQVSHKIKTSTNSCSRRLITFPMISNFKWQVAWATVNTGIEVSVKSTLLLIHMRYVQL